MPLHKNTLVLIRNRAAWWVGYCRTAARARVKLVVECKVKHKHNMGAPWGGLRSIPDSAETLEC